MDESAWKDTKAHTGDKPDSWRSASASEPFKSELSIDGDAFVDQTQRDLGGNAWRSRELFNTKADNLLVPDELVEVKKKLRRAMIKISDLEESKFKFPKVKKLSLFKVSLLMASGSLLVGFFLGYLLN